MGLPPFSLLTSPPQAEGFQGRTLSHTLAPAVVMSFSQTSCLKSYLFIVTDSSCFLGWPTFEHPSSLWSYFPTGPVSLDRSSSLPPNAAASDARGLL